MIKNVGYTDSATYTCLDDLGNSIDYPMFNSIVLDYCGKEACLPGHQFGPYIRERYVMHFVLEGKGTFITKHGKYRLKKGDAFLISPDEETTYRADAKEPWTYAWIGFHGYRVPGFVEKMGLAKEKPVITLDNPSEIVAYIERMIRERQLTAVNELRRLSSLLEIIALVIEQQMKKKKNNSHDYPRGTYVRYAVDYMTYNYKKRIKIDELADMIGISRSHLTLSFKKEMNTSPQEFLVNLRMEKACELLRDTTDPINNIASDVGYSDSMAFSKAFKQKMGESPKAYRETKVELVKKDNKGDYNGDCPL